MSAESATIVMPQTMHKATSAAGAAPNSRPTVAAQVPLTAMAAMVRVVRPKRSAR